MDHKRSLVDELNPTKPRKLPAKKLLKYVVSLGLLSYLLHRWLSLAVNSTNDPYPWAIDAFAPKEPSYSQLAENFFL
jgi:hypothetical protein